MRDEKDTVLLFQAPAAGALRYPWRVVNHPAYRLSNKVQWVPRYFTRRHLAVQWAKRKQVRFEEML